MGRRGVGKAVSNVAHLRQRPKQEARHAKSQTVEGNEPDIIPAWCFAAMTPIRGGGKQKENSEKEVWHNFLVFSTQLNYPTQNASCNSCAKLGCSLAFI